MSLKRAVVIYWSKTGNTEKVAFAVKEGLEGAGVEVSTMTSEEAGDVDFFDYDLVCIGSPSYMWHPPKPMADYLITKFSEYKEQGRVKLSAPKIPGKNALIFCTYSGPHTGINEAAPAGKYIGQFFEHLGFTVIDEWYVLGEFHGWEEGSKKGAMGDLRGRPNEEDLMKVKEDAENIARRL